MKAGGAWRSIGGAGGATIAKSLISLAAEHGGAGGAAICKSLISLAEHGGAEQPPFQGAPPACAREAGDKPLDKPGQSLSN